MTRTLAKLDCYGGEFRIVYNESKALPYALILKRWNIERCDFQQNTIERFTSYTEALDYAVNTVKINERIRRR